MNKSVALLLLAGLVGAPLGAQDDPYRPPLPSTGVPLLDDARREQRMFEEFRQGHLPAFNGKGAGSTNDQEVVGRFIYWYNENEPPAPPEPLVIKAQRARLLGILDSAAARYPQDDWTAGQLIRYLSEDGRVDAEIKVANNCSGEPWWCSALLGFAYHEARQFVRADSAYAAALRLMPQRLRCDWSDASVLLDEYTLRTYHRFACGTAERTQYEARMWWLAKPLYALPGFDTRTEYFARMTMVRMLEDAPSPYQYGFDIDERELLLRYGWPRAWSMAAPARAGPIFGGRGGGMGGRRGDDRDMGRDGGTPPSIVGHEPAPSYQFLMPALTSNSPAMSDSVDWETGVPPVHARYAPMYARRIGALIHQSALFRRGDSSLVVLAWDATSAPIRPDAKLQMALVLARADSLQPVITKMADAPRRGVIVGKGPWSQLLMSAELTAAGVDTAIRARYGLRPPYAMGARVTVSEMLFFSEYDGLPASVEQAAQHAMPSIRIRSDQKLGIYFETYGTNPAGEKLKVTFTVAREEDEPGFVRRRLQSLRISKEASPVRLTIEDQSALGQRTTPRSAYLDIKTLKKGSYIVQLEVEVAGQYVVRAERALEVIS